MSRPLPQISPAPADARPVAPPAWSDPRRGMPGTGLAEATAESMVLGAIVSGEPSCGFACRRAWREAERVQESGRRRHLLNVLRTCTDPDQDGEARTCSLLEWAGYHEGRFQFAEAAAILDRAVEEGPSNLETVLGRARVARKNGDLARARALYRRVRQMARDEVVMADLAEVGEAMVAQDPEAALTVVVHRLRRSSEPEVIAVALEARAEIRRKEGRVGAALRDYLGAAVRFEDPMDRGRLGQEMADMLLAEGDPLAAREVLLATLEHAHPQQVAAVTSRLRGLARSMGDDVGVRRWSDAPTPHLVTLGLSRARAGGNALRATRAGRISAWLRRMGVRAAG